MRDSYKGNFFFIVNVDWFFLSHRLQLARAVLAEGYKVFILSKDSGRKAEIEAYGLKFINIDFERSGKNPIKELFAVFEIRKFIRQYKPVIVHNVTIKPALYGSIASKLNGDYRSPAVINAISGLGYNFIGERKGFVQQILKKLMDYAFSRNVNFIFQNPDDQKLYRDFGYLNLNKHKIIKGAGVDGEDFQYSEPSEKPKLEVVLTARMLLDKGILEFMEAARILKQHWTGRAIFKLVGDIDSENPAGITEEELRGYLIPNYIVWEGHQKNIKVILENADIACLPSYREGLPKSLIEAMAIGRPIVSTDVPGCRECVEDDYNGFLVPSHNSEQLAQALEKLLVDRELRIQMGLNSRAKMVNELSLDKVISETLSFYKEILL